ncbi:MAG: hypothetical protein GY856_34730 [bacterium]|nr:hypothetical protein [bacterium]
MTNAPRRVRGLWVPVLAIAVYLVAVFVRLGGDREAAEHVFDANSCFHTGPQGLSLAAAYLAERGRPVHTLHRRVDVRELARDGVVLRLGAGASWTERDEAWIVAGGRLVLAPASSSGEPELEQVPEGAGVFKVFPLGPTVEEIVPPEGCVFAGDALGEGHAVLVAGGGALLGRVPVGRGEVFLLACPELFQNAHLGEADHLALLEALAGTGRTVYFDETVHGLGRPASLPDELRRWGFGPALALALTAALAAAWRGARRLGPAEDDRRETRSEAVDMVDSLGRLYRRALRRGDALRLYHRELRRAAGAQLLLRGAALDRRVAELTDGFEPPPSNGGEALGAVTFQRRLAVLNSAFRRLRDARRIRGR